MAEAETRKELSPGVTLIKIVKKAPLGTALECIYEYKVDLQRFNSLDFTADFSGSESILLEGASGLVRNTTIHPFNTETVAVVSMNRQWSLKSRFKFTLKPVPKSIQETYLVREEARIRDLRKRCADALGKIPVSICPLNELEQVLISKNLNFVDPEFPPEENSVFRDVPRESLDGVMHWRRPGEFLASVPGTRAEPTIFGEGVEPLDVVKGQLGNNWFLGALATLAERPALIERLFLTKQPNPLGIYRVKICKNGEWQVVTIDDYFPCYTLGAPLFSRCQGNELWVLILEKVYAKLHGSYYLLKGGLAYEALLDLTGSPTTVYTFQEQEVSGMIKSGEFWKLLLSSDQEGFLLCASTLGEDRWRDYDEKLPAGLLPGHCYAVISLHEVRGSKVVHLRNPWGKLEWRGDWSKTSRVWNSEAKSQLQPEFNDDDSSFYMSYSDFVQHFANLSVCRIRNWEEVRMKGKFIRVPDVEDSNVEVIMSKWYYSLDLTHKCSLHIGIHQEDERISGVATRRSYLDIGFIVLKRLSDGSVAYVTSKDLVMDRQCELEVTLDPGAYIVLPRTTGCLLRRPVDLPSESVSLLSPSGSLSELAESTINDVFRKFDMLLNRELSYTEFKGFYECINKHITETEFRQSILRRFKSSETGISAQGFRDFFLDSVKTQGQETVFTWFEALGYDRELFSIRSRCFILTLHSVEEISVTVRDAIQTDIDNRANVILLERFGAELDNKNAVCCLYMEAKSVHAYSYGIRNDRQQAIEAILDCSASEQMLASTKTAVVKKVRARQRIEPGQLEFMLHTQALPSAESYVRSARCTWGTVAS